MAKPLNAKCKICGKPYHLCSSCAKTKSFTPWRTVTCSTNCYKIYSTLSMYTNGYSTKEETKDILEKCDLSKVDSFVENIKVSIENIMKKPKAKKKNTTKEAVTKNCNAIIENDNDGVPNENIE